MAEILWKQHLDTMYDVSNVGTVRNRKTGRNMKLTKISKGYFQWGCCGNGLKVKTLVHRAVAEAFLENPEGYPTVDHRNRDKSNNRLENLQWASYSMQMRNQGVRGEVPFKGVTISKNGERFQARITINNNIVHIGTYATAEEAGAAYVARCVQEGFGIPQ